MLEKIAFSGKKQENCVPKLNFTHFANFGASSRNYAFLRIPGFLTIFFTRFFFHVIYQQKRNRRPEGS
jgi:hypothetical protein